MLLRFRLREIAGLNLSGQVRLNFFNPPNLLFFLLVQDADREHKLLLLFGPRFGFFFRQSF